MFHSICNLPMVKLGPRLANMTQSYDKALQKRSEEIIRNKYFNAFNFYFSKPINELLANCNTPEVILFKDFLYYDDDREFCKRYYQSHELPNKMNTLTTFYAENNFEQSPNLCIHEQNKIICKRNLKLHKIFLAKLKAYEDMPNTAREQYIARKIELGYRDSDSEELTETDPALKRKAQNELAENGGINFKKMLDFGEQSEREGQQSFETQVHNIYSQKSSSEEESKVKQSDCPQGGNVRPDEGARNGLNKHIVSPFPPNAWSKNKEPSQSHSIVFGEEEDPFAKYQEFVSKQPRNNNSLNSSIPNDVSNQSDLLMIHQMISEGIEKEEPTHRRNGSSTQEGRMPKPVIPKSVPKRDNFVSEQAVEKFAAKPDFRKPQKAQGQPHLKESDINSVVKGTGLDLKRLEQVARELEDRVKGRRQDVRDDGIKSHREHKPSSNQGSKPQSHNGGLSDRRHLQKSHRGPSEQVASTKQSPGRASSNRSSAQQRTKHAAHSKDNHSPAQYINEMTKRNQRQLSEPFNGLEQENVHVFRKGSVLSKITMNDDAMNEHLRKEKLKQIYLGAPAPRLKSHRNKSSRTNRRMTRQAASPEDLLKEIQHLQHHDHQTLKQDASRAKSKKTSSVSSKENQRQHSGERVVEGSQTARDQGSNTFRKKAKAHRFGSNEGLSHPAALAAINNYFLTTTNSLNSFRTVQDRVFTDDRLQSAATVDTRYQKTEGSVGRKDVAKSTLQKRPDSTRKKSTDKVQHRQPESRKSGSISSFSNTNYMFSNPSSIPVSPSRHLGFKLNLDKVKEMQKRSRMGSITQQDDLEQAGNNYGFISSRSVKDDGKAKGNDVIGRKRGSVEKQTAKRKEKGSGPRLSSDFSNWLKEKQDLIKAKMKHQSDLHQDRMTSNFTAPSTWRESPEKQQQLSKRSLSNKNTRKKPVSARGHQQ